MISARPNLAYLKAAWAAHAGISAENCRQTYEEAGISFERVNHSWIVRKDDTQVSTMPLRYTRQELRLGFLGRIEMEARKAAAEIEGVLLRDLDVPEDHVLIVELEESMRHLRRKGSRALAIFIAPTASADLSSRACVQLQVFLDAPRACLFAHRLDAEGYAGTDLLAGCSKRERHPRATTYVELGQHIVATLNTALEQCLGEAREHMQ
ncbi:hypothetical protein DWU98_06610 [Dyella monticola]|uniref:Uncharacterized protein n=1 Tax=Dyella monticola TaxID=1927958 RepID=A0A370X391_9GAMM|nr:hypothetical protein [Dyella monticola]RDS82816.1 hypothetical protein DWU98_06610 [Dyella monticola]